MNRIDRRQLPSGLPDWTNKPKEWSPIEIAFRFGARRAVPIGEVRTLISLYQIIFFSDVIAGRSFERGRLVRFSIVHSNI